MIRCLLRVSYAHVFDSLRLNKLCNFRLSEGYFVAKYKKFPGGIAFCVHFANVSAFFTSTHTRVWICLFILAEEMSSYHDIVF